MQQNDNVELVATQDLDLLVTNPPEVSREVDIPELLSKYDLEEEHHRVRLSKLSI